MDFDELQMKMGGLSLYQISTFTFVLIAVLGPGFAGQFAVFLSAVPEYRCDFPENSEFLTDSSEEQILNLTVPYSYEKQDYERCHQLNINYTRNCNQSECIGYEEGFRKCEHGFVYSKEYFEETTVSEFDLVCDRQYLDTIVNTIFCVGYFFGSVICGPLCDWFGRKKALTLHCFLYTCFGLGMCFSPNFYTFMVLRFLSACAAIAAYLTAFTYVSEICPQKYRNTLILICSLSQSFAHILVPVFGYVFRRWRIVGIVGSLLPLPLLFFYPFIPESPRWLLSTNRVKEAKKVVKKIAKSHNTQLDESDWENVLKVETYGNSDDVKNYTVIDLFRTKRTRFISLIVAQAWFTCSILFYGMTLNIGNFFGNPYLNGLINAGIEIFGNLIFLFSPWIGKTKLLSLVYLLSGLACIASTICDIYFKGSMIAVVLAVFGKMNAQAVQLLIYSVTSEIYPTLARGTGMSLGSMSARIGCAITPLTIQLQTTIPWATQTIFGILGILSAIASLFLPNTQNTSFFRTVDEAEDFYRRKLTLYNKIFGYPSGKDLAEKKLDDGELVEKRLLDSKFIDENGNLEEINNKLTDTC